MLEIQVNRSIPRTQKITVPGSKSYSNRALLLAALAEGTSTIEGLLESEDTNVMLAALRALGTQIKKKGGTYFIQGSGGKFKDPGKPLMLENAGTAMRSLTAVMSTQEFTSTITGNKRMHERPIHDLAEALTSLGVHIQTSKGCPPVKTRGPLEGGETSIRGNISSQYLSALLMAAPYALRPIDLRVEGQLTSRPYIDMTLAIMKTFGVPIKHRNYRQFSIRPKHYTAANYKIEGDASSATYPLALAALHGTSLTILNIPSSSQQADLLFLDVLKKMGCAIKRSKNQFTVKGPKQLKPLRTINLNKMPDAAMTVAMLCAFTKGKSKLTGLANLRLKETDRLKALTAELRKIGVTVAEGKDYLEIHGDPKELHGALIETYNDHRMAMCFAIAGSRIPNIRIIHPSCVQKTYPTFWQELKQWGIKGKKVKKRTQPNLILSGLRGTGKTSLGKKLAAELGYNFIDTDDLIAQKFGPIPEIVRKHGWEHFRKLENQIARTLSSTKKTVIATGGGMLINPKNVNYLKKNGYVLLLKATPQTLARRIQGDKNRPRLTNATTLIQEFRELWKQRRENYLSTCDFMLRVDVQSSSRKKDLQEKANQIILDFQKLAD